MEAMPGGGVWNAGQRYSEDYAHFTKEKTFTRFASLFGQDYCMILVGEITKEKPFTRFARLQGFDFHVLCRRACNALKIKTLPLSRKGFSFVGVAGFEPATLWSQTRCANRAALHPASTTVALVKAVKLRPQKYKEFFNYHRIRLVILDN